MKVVSLKVGLITCAEETTGVLNHPVEIVDLIKSGGGVMTLEDLASCEAEVITPIKYDFKVGTAGDDGVTLWEVSWSICKISSTSSLTHPVPTKWTGPDGVDRLGYCGGSRDTTWYRLIGGGTQLRTIHAYHNRGTTIGLCR
jgi:hypothetical protein